jgi:hypothetical protein
MTTEMKQRLRRFETLVDEGNVSTPENVERLTAAIRRRAFVPGVAGQIRQARDEVMRHIRGAYDELVTETR